MWRPRYKWAGPAHVSTRPIPAHEHLLTRGKPTKDNNRVLLEDALPLVLWKYRPVDTRIRIGFAKYPRIGLGGDGELKMPEPIVMKLNQSK